MIEVSFLLFYYCERKISFINFEHMKFSRFLLILVKLTWLKRTHDQSLLRVTSKLWEKCSVKKVQARASLVGRTKLEPRTASFIVKFEIFCSCWLQGFGFRHFSILMRVKVMLMTSWWWWIKVDDWISILTATFECCYSARRIADLGDQNDETLKNILVVINIFRLQHISVTNIDLTLVGI